MVKRIKDMPKKEERIMKIVLYIAGIASICCGAFHTFYAKFAPYDIVFGSFLCILGLSVIIVTSMISHWR